MELLFQVQAVLFASTVRSPELAGEGGMAGV